MTRSIGWLLGLAMAGTAAGQATVEAGLGAARAATSTAPAAGLGKSMSGLAGALDKALKPGQPAAETRPAAKTSPEPEAKPAAATKWEDPGGIETGLSYTELVRRFGPPALEISGEAGRSLTYMGKSGTFHVAVENDQVTGVRKPKS
jgi:hypothetical protein